MTRDEIAAALRVLAALPGDEKSDGLPRYKLEANLALEQKACDQEEQAKHIARIEESHELYKQDQEDVRRHRRALEEMQGRHFQRVLTVQERGFDMITAGIREGFAALATAVRDGLAPHYKPTMVISPSPRETGNGDQATGDKQQ